MRFDITIPIHGILCDGATFQFFNFDASTKPYKFSMGVPRGSRFRVSGGLPLADFSSEPTARSFIHSLRPICETVFNLLLVAYSASLKVYHDRSASRNGQRNSLDGWEKALKFAAEALDKSQRAEEMRQENKFGDADAGAEAAFSALKLRYLFVGKFYFPCKLIYQQYRCRTYCRGIRERTANGWLG